MSRLVLLNGPPGSGKSTVAARLAATRPSTSAVDVDLLKHRLPSWGVDAAVAGLQARELALQQCRDLLRAGFDVVVAQYLAQTSFIEALAKTAADESVGFVEIVLVLGPDALAERLTSRALTPDRVEHRINNALVLPTDAGRLVATLDPVLAARPWTLRIAAGGSLAGTLNQIDALLGHSEQPAARSHRDHDPDRPG